MASFLPLNANLPVLRPLVLPPATPAVQAVAFNRVSSLLARQDQLHVAPSLTRSLPPPLSLSQPQIPASQPALTLRPLPQKALPALPIADMAHQLGINRLKTMQPQELKALGENDKQAFFAALLPAAIESEKKFGVPAEVTLAQAALESGWAASPIGGYNIFGIKGQGPAGTVAVRTHEFENGKRVNITDNFAKYHNFHEAVERHGKLFHNGYYDKAVTTYAKNRNVEQFIDNIHGIYATDPKYADKLKSLISEFGLEEMVNHTAMV